ncbi:MAG: hypothetical protein KatS3mg088_584 [Patescibacteria group bacterium]|nr:MAG: hypothetical protein KatS3mg088_584 [Patescibacteria group bacterium]
MAKTKEEKITRVIAKNDDGSIQITFSVPKGIVAKAEEKALSEIGKDIQVPGFRKGKAPISKVKENIRQEELIEKILTNTVLPALREAFEEERIKPIVYPKFELVSIKEGEDWQVRVLTCELPDVDLANYKEKIIKDLKPNQIWTPDKKGEESTKESREEKEQKVIESLIKNIDIKIPNLLIEEEVNSRLSQLLERIEKLGLSLEKYLESIGKTAQSLREEYEKQTKEAIALELILNKIAQQENIKVEEKEVDEILKISGENLNNKDDLQRRELVKNIISRRKALEFLTSLI